MSAGNRIRRQPEGHALITVTYGTVSLASSTSCRFASIQSWAESPCRESWSRRSAMKYARIRISSSDGSAATSRGAFARPGGLFAEAGFFFGALFFFRGGAGALFRLGFDSTIPSVARAAGSRPAGSVSFPDSTLDFLATCCSLRLSAQSTDETGVASGFCKRVARGAELRVPCKMMGQFVFHWMITTGAVMITPVFISRIRYDTAGALTGAALLLGIVNAFVRPVLLILSRPLMELTESGGT